MRLRHLVAASVLALAFTAQAAQPATSTSSSNVQKLTKQIDAVAKAQLLPVTVSAIFAAVADIHETHYANGMVTIAAPNVDVMIVKIEADGTRTHACVNNEAAATAILSSGDETPKSKKE